MDRARFSPFPCFGDRRRRSGPTYLDKGFNLELWDHSRPDAVVRFGYLTSASGHDTPQYRPIWAYEFG